MKKILALGLGVATALVGTAALADDAAASGGGSSIALGARLGYAFAMGESSKDAKMSDYVKSAIPLQIDALYKVTPSIGVGLYFSYAIGQMNSDTYDSGSAMFYGLQAQYRLNPGENSAWFGYGIGMESVTGKPKGGGNDVKVSGLDLARISAGYDFNVSPKFGVGPFADFTYGQYSSADYGGGSNDIANKSAHEWLTIGVHGNYDL